MANDDLFIPVPTAPPANVTTGSARTVTNQKQLPASFPPNQKDNIRQDPTKTGSDSLFFNTPLSTDAPPFKNILEDFASFNTLWTMCCLDPNQYNNPESYRGNDSELSNIVLSSAGRYDKQRIGTEFGSPEYFIDNVHFDSIIAPRSPTGNTNVITFSFEIYEPYSMGLFLQSLQVAAVNAGYRTYLEAAPFLLKLDFKGTTDEGNRSPNVDYLTKYFSIKLTNVTMKVDEGGSKYVVTAIPFHHLGFGNTVNVLRADTKLLGGTVQEVLSSGTVSLVSRLNTEQSQLANNKVQAIPDIYEIVFPANSSDNLGITSEASTSIVGATIDPLSKVTNVISKVQSVAKSVKNLSSGAIGSLGSLGSAGAGGNKIGTSTMNFSLESGGNVSFSNESEVINEKSKTTDKSKVKIDSNSREFRFSRGDTITQVIQKVILVSNYASDAIKVENLDQSGMASWFRIDVQIQLLDYDAIRSTRARKYIFRVIPFKVSGALIKTPNAPAIGIPELAKIIAKRYDYIYTGQNNSIIKFELEFNAMFFTGAQPRPLYQTGTNNLDAQNTTDSAKLDAPVNQGSDKPATSSTAGSTMVGPDPDTVKNSPIGWKTVEQQIADSYQTAFLSASPDLVNLEIETTGDPYFLSDSGINSNYFSKEGINNQITNDNAMNYEGSEIFVYLAFRTPINPNIEPTDVNSGLYNFGKDGISPFSGIFKVIQVANIFASGNYTQTMKLIRVLGQPNDFVGKESIVAQNTLLYAASIPVPKATTPAADSSVNANKNNTPIIDDPEAAFITEKKAIDAAQANKRPSSS
jgi:hypothetical protein